MTSEKLSFIYSRNKGKIETRDIPFFEKIRAKFSVKNPGAKYSQWASASYCPITPTGLFEIGLFYDILKVIKTMSPGIEISISDELKVALQPITFKKDEIEYFFNDKFVERDYQREIIDKCLTYGRALFSSPTGSGKSFIIYSIVQNLRKKHTQVQNILILVPTIQLVKQMHTDFLEYGMDPTSTQMFSAFAPEITQAPVIVANRQWIENHSDELPKIDAVIVDECQQLSSNNNVTKFVRKLETQIRFGCSGTIPTDKITRWGILGTIGPIIYSVKAHKMQEEGFISNIKIRAIQFKHLHKPVWQITDDNYSRMHYIEYAWVENHPKILEFFAKFMPKLPGNSLILFDHTEHGNNLFAAIEAAHVGGITRFINGEVPLSDREDTRTLMEANDNVILVANCKAAGVGLNVKNIHNIVFAMTGKAETKIIQSVGRGVRLLEGKHHLNLYDFYHNFKYSLRHFEERVSLYKDHYKKELDIHRSVEIDDSGVNGND